MSDEYEDPSGSTMAFRAYMERQEQEQEQGEGGAARASRLPLILGGVAVGIVVLALVAWLAVG